MLLEKREGKKMGKVIGIDLGTTNSCVAVVEGGEAIIIPAGTGARTTPSVVAFTKNGERLVGEVAKRQLTTNAERTISSVKRHMGTDWSVKIDGKEYKPQTISAMVLMQLKKEAEDFIGELVTDAVITVPAYFNDVQRQAMRDAKEYAGQDSLRREALDLIHEGNILLSRVQQALKNAGKQIDKAEKKQIKSDSTKLQKCLMKIKVDSVSDEEIGHLKELKEQLETSGSHLLSTWQ